MQGGQQLPVADAEFELGLYVALEVLQQPQFQDARLGQGGVRGERRQSAEDVGVYQPVFQPVLAVCQQLGGQGRVGRLVPGTANGARQCLGEEVALLPAIEALGGAGDEALLGGELERSEERRVGKEC